MRLHSTTWITANHATNLPLVPEPVAQAAIHAASRCTLLGRRRRVRTDADDIQYPWQTTANGISGQNEYSRPTL